MAIKDTILKSVHYIEDNLKNEIDVMSVASEVCYSLYHFTRLFQSITGFSPKSYIQQRRLTEAANDLRNSTAKIANIAYDYQFGSPEAFTRAFRRQFNINPTELRKGHSLSAMQLLMPVSPESIYQSDTLNGQPPELIERDETILVGLSFFIKDGTEINDLSEEWNRLISEVKTVVSRVKPERYFQVQYWSEIQDLGGMYFFTGVEVCKAENLNPLFVVKTLPAGRYLRFIHRGLSNKVGYTYQYIYNQFLPVSDYKLPKAFNFEFYGEKHLGPYNEKSESEIFIPVS